MSRGRVLLAEDDRDMRCLIAEALRDDGYDVVEVASGVEMIDYMESSALYGGPFEAPDLIISDIRMQGYSGFEALAGLRRADWQTPFILITALGEHETFAEARRLGATFVFHKPFEVDDLRTAVINLTPPSPRPMFLRSLHERHR
jgi:CheY-like chemotaxis protein